MRAVWSFWSRPFQTYKGNIWCKPLHHLLAWGLSVRTASRHYPDTVLITDRPGKKLLVERLGLHFAEVSTELERLNKVDVGWWALGKLVAYSLQDRPFVHLDTDVFLWKPLPRHVTGAPVFAQCPEEFHSIDTSPGPRDIEQAFARQNLSLPVEWVWARSRGGSGFREDCCGIMGGTRVDFLRHYSNLALDLVLKPEHAPAWAIFPAKEWLNMVIEQFLLAACVDFHRFHAASPFRGVRIQYLFPSFGHCFDPQLTARVGFTHLMGGAKSHPAVARRLEERVRRENPDYFRRCERLVANMT
jgi:hypothetical protein